MLLTLIIVSTFVTNNVSTTKAQESQPFHVGVTFGWDNSADAKIQIDKVKDYTNLFVVASGQLQNDPDELQIHVIMPSTQG